MRVVGSLTTIPSRIGHIEKTLHSIIDQSYKLDELYLNIPYSCSRENIEYVIPDSFSNYCNIIRGQDYGPLTKLIGPLLIEQDPDTVIITFNDDAIYPESLVEKLLSKHAKDPEVAIGSSGIKIGAFPFYLSMTFNDFTHNKRWFAFNVNNNGELVDILLGSSGILYVRKFFPDVDHIGKLLEHIEDNVLFRNESVLVSGLLSQRNIDRRVYRMPCVEDSGNNNNSLSNNKSDYAFSLIKAIYRCKKKGMFKKQVVYAKNTTFTYPIIIALAIIIAISILYSIKK